MICLYDKFQQVFLLITPLASLLPQILLRAAGGCCRSCPSAGDRSYHNLAVHRFDQDLISNNNSIEIKR